MYTDPLKQPSPSFTTSDLGLRQFIDNFNLTWSRVDSDCLSVHYNILASNCDSCPTTTNQANVTCTNTSTDNSTCVFTIKTVACGNTTGNVSDDAQGGFKGIN